MSVAAFRSIDPDGYRPHALHRDGRGWMETNCYVDVWLELLHALELDPVAALAFTIAIDFEGDQWTFYKYGLGDLWDAYGLDTQELQPWRGPLESAVEQLGRGRVVLMETDAFYLPDTAATNYHRDHLNKTTIGIQELDVDAKVLRYFHGAGYWELAGADFDGALFVGRAPGSYLYPYVEYVKLDGLVRRPDAELREIAVAQLCAHLARRPKQNPFQRFRVQLSRDLEWLRAEPDRFHPYAFATLRQLGSCYDLAGVFLRWLEQRGEQGLDTAAVEMDNLSGTAKVVQMKLARVAATKRPFDATEMMDVMEKSWDSAMALLAARYG